MQIKVAQNSLDFPSLAFYYSKPDDVDAKRLG